MPQGFTSILGTPLTEYANIELARLPLPSAVGPVQGEVHQAPPMFGAPFFRPVIEPTQALAQGTPRYNRTPMPEITGGPPLRGSPFQNHLPAERAARVQGVPVVPPSPYVAVQEIVSGPPYLGAPFTQRLPVTPTFSQAPPPPIVPQGMQTTPPEINFGPPLRGAPFLQRLPIVPAGVAPAPSPLPPPPPPPVPSKSLRPLLVRVKGADSHNDSRRLDRFTEQVASIVNSLASQGILVQTGVASWTLDVTGIGVFSFNGRTGAITLKPADLAVAYPALPPNVVFASPGPAFRLLLATDLPFSGVVPGGYTFATINVDQYGRVVLAANGVTVPVWIGLAALYQNGWADFGSGFQVGQYTKDITGRVHLRGLLATGTQTNPTLLFTLPVGFRPPATVLVEAFANDTSPVRMDVATTGTVTYTVGTTSPGYLSLDGVSFST